MNKLSLAVVPEYVALVDERIEIKVNGLSSFQKVTLRTELWSQPGTKMPFVFESYGHFISDIHGSLNLTKNASFGGTYKGVDGMGLFWSMVQVPGQRKGGRFIPSDVTRPLEFKVSLYDGHVTSEREAKSVEEALENLPTPLATTTILRTYLSDNVERHEISVGRIRGTLFVPKGNRRFPGVLDMFGSHGGLLEHRAAILASHGFVVLALAFFAYKDLPDKVENLELEYFIEAVEWLSRHDKVYQNGIGVVGVSYGGQIALQVAAECPIVKAVVPISSSHIIYTPVMFKGKSSGFQKIETIRHLRILDDDTLVLRDAINYDNKGLRNIEIPVEKIKGNILLVNGYDDMCLNTTAAARRIKERLLLNKRPPLKCISYPGTGHLIEVPYMPMSSISYDKILHMFYLWGGNVVEHSAAQEHSWNAIKEFLMKNINGSGSKL